MLSAKKLYTISRPRFWIYIFGPLLVGTAAGANTVAELADWRILLWGLYFLFPANLLIYGVNDIFDWETDAKNAKKEGYETRVRPQNHKQLCNLILAINLPVIGLLFFTPTAGIYAFIAFLFFSIFYSAKPIRAKAIPILDSAFNILYILPGALGFYLAGGTYLDPSLLVAGALWAAAMHAYSAVPDISADKAAGVETIATTFGFTRTLWICGGLYLASAALAFMHIPSIALVLAAVYSTMIMISLKKKTETELMSVYRFFPIVNTCCGALLFLITASKFL